LSNGCSDDKVMYGLPVSASEEVALDLVVDANINKPIQCLLSFYLIAFSFKRLVRGHCPGVVTNGDDFTHRHFTEVRMLAVMRPPFSWSYHQEPLPWCGDQLNGSVISLHAHGPNRLARDETPYPPTRS
jgi:hypothetical protein